MKPVGMVEIRRFVGKKEPGVDRNGQRGGYFVEAWTDPKAPLVVTSVNTPEEMANFLKEAEALPTMHERRKFLKERAPRFYITHMQSSRTIATYKSVVAARRALALFEPLTDWTQGQDVIIKLGGLGRKVRELKIATKALEASA
jgi:hypothetical protein